MCATRPKNENESKNEKHGDKSECVYDNVKIKIESTKVVNTRLVCRVCKCVGVVVRTCETCIGVTTVPPSSKRERKPVERTKMKVR